MTIISGDKALLVPWSRVSFYISGEKIATLTSEDRTLWEWSGDSDAIIELAVDAFVFRTVHDTPEAWGRKVAHASPNVSVVVEESGETWVPFADTAIDRTNPKDTPEG